MAKNKYAVDCKGRSIDVYDVLNAFGVTCPAAQHAIKKLLMAGKRGHKSELGDLLEARASVDRAIDLALERWRIVAAEAERKAFDAIFSQGTALAMGVCDDALTDRELRDAIIRNTVDEEQGEPSNASPKFCICPACGENQIDGECSFTLCPTHTEAKESK